MIEELMKYDYDHPNVSHRCLTCGKPILWSFAIFNKCEEICGCSAKERPEWLNYFWNDTQQTRRRNKQIARYEYPESNLEDPEDDGGEVFA